MDENGRNRLWENYSVKKTPELREQIIIEYAPLVKLVAGRLSMYLGYNVEYEDLVSYGLIPELIGRLHVITTLDPIDKDAMVAILTKPKNALIKQYQKLFLMDGARLNFDKDAIEKIAELAVARKIGARGLRSIIEESISDLMDDLPELKDCEITITKNCIDGMHKPLVVKKVSKKKTLTS